MNDDIRSIIVDFFGSLDNLYTINNMERGLLIYRGFEWCLNNKYMVKSPHSYSDCVRLRFYYDYVFVDQMIIAYDANPKLLSQFDLRSSSFFTDLKRCVFDYFGYTDD